MSNTRTQKSQEASFNEFMKQMEVFRGHAAELQAMADDHIGADPDSMLWGAAGTIGTLRGKTAQSRRGMVRLGDLIRS